MSTRNEEILLEMFDSGWGRPMPVRLITYKDGTMDIHSQTGPDFEARINAAEKLLILRGLVLETNDEWMYGSTGAYRGVVKL